MKSKPFGFTVLITGVGGQGITLLSKAIAAAAFGQYSFVCRTESRGLSQRGGSVSCAVRFGNAQLAALVGTGSEDLILSTDALEGVRALPFLKTNGTLITNSQFIVPAYLSNRWEHGGGDVETEASLSSRIKQMLGNTTKIFSASFETLARDINCQRCVNTLVLGAASHVLPIPGRALRNAMLSLISQDRCRNSLAFDIGQSTFGKMRHHSRTATAVDSAVTAVQ